MEIWCNKTRKFKKFTPRVFKTILHLVFTRNTRTNRPIPLIDEPDVSHQRKRSKSSPNRLIHTRHTRPLLAIPRWIGEGRVWKLFAKPSLDPFVDQLRNTKWPAPNISLRLCGKHFRAENRANEISLRRGNLLSRATQTAGRERRPTRWNFHFQSVSRPFSFFLSSPLFHFARSSTRGSSPTRNSWTPSPPMASVCPTIEFTARVERSKGHAQSDARWKYGVEAITRRIGVSCLTKRPSSMEGRGIVSINEENRR